MNPSKNARIRLAAMGDLLLSTRPGAVTPGRGLEALGQDLRELFASCDVVFANLECTLPGRETVPTEPRVVSTEKQISSLHNSGINVVTLSNNHAFDCLDEGFSRLTSVLASENIKWFGAGQNLKEALKPLIFEIRGIKIAFFGCVAESTGASIFAKKDSYGVAPLDTDEICRLIKDISNDVNIILVSPHWGRERFRIPAPEQIKQAKAFAESGASMVLGHHPHVMQGFEYFGKTPIIYSMGNFLGNHVYWQDGDLMSWSRFERTGIIVIADLNEHGVLNWRQIPVFDDGKKISIEKSGFGDRYLRKVNRMLAKGITQKLYNREELYIEIVKPVLSHLRWSEIVRIRPRNIRNLSRIINRYRAR